MASPALFFDEVDTGVSGRVAQAIANKISTIATQSQVLCITHLPQVAAMSDHEYLIQKASRKWSHQNHSHAVDASTAR
jgi:DNA repair protein RecN (Recombination protein N)